MTITEAIEIIEAACNHEERFHEEQLWDAQKLGIEALKRLYNGRAKGYAYFGHLMPGETEELK